MSRMNGKEKRIGIRNRGNKQAKILTTGAGESWAESKSGGRGGIRASVDELGNGVSLLAEG